MASNRIFPRLLAYMAIVWLVMAPGAAGAAWRDAPNRATLRNKALQADFQAGMLGELKDVATGKTLLAVDPAKLPGKLPIFGKSGIDLDACEVSQEAGPEAVVTRFRAPDGTEWKLRWSIEKDAGDLVLQASARTPKPVAMLRFVLGGCDIADHDLVQIGGYGVGQVYRAPWKKTFGDPDGTACAQSYHHPLVALFEGKGTGWFVEGRDPKLGPAVAFSRGRGDVADVSMIRGFPFLTKTPEMYEIRIRAYGDRWMDAVDPYIKWMERGAGFAPLGTGHHPAWVSDIKNQAYVRVGDIEGLDQLAKRVDPNRTLVGRMVGWRKYPMDTFFPDYTPAKEAVKWFRHARKLGFHVGAHFNSQRLSSNFVELVKRFRPSFQVTGRDADGNEVYEGIDRTGPDLISCSAAFKPWRDQLVKEIRAAVEVGVDVVYLDESMAPGGTYIVDGVTGTEGVMLLMKEVAEAYPGVAIETEQFNTLSARGSSFALSQMPLGHPLSGYIFSHFIKIVPEGVMGSPLDNAMMDAFAAWGFMVPHASFEESWLRVARAFQDYDLVPDLRLPRTLPERYESHYTHGWFPTYAPVPAGESIKLFGYRGRDGTTAYFEKKDNRRGLVIYEPDKQPQWIGTRVMGVRKWSGPGALLEFVSGVDVMSEWLVYDGKTQLALDPKKSYLLDEKAVLPPDRFHLARIPEDFALYKDDNYRIEAQYAGTDASWFKINVTGHGEVAMFVPDGFLVFVDGEPVRVDRAKKIVPARIDTAPDKPSAILAFRPSDAPLVGPWKDLPWQLPREQRNWYVGQHVRMEYPSDGPLLQEYRTNAFYCHVGGWGLIVGKLPSGKSVKLSGAYAMLPETTSPPCDGVLRINGKEVLRIAAGQPPFQTHAFDVDLAAFAGQHVLIEFASEGRCHGAGQADWYNPLILVEP